MNALLAKLAAAGCVRRADRALGEWISRSFPEAPPEAAPTAALAARAVADGHSALELDRAQPWLRGIDADGEPPRLPEPDAWRTALQSLPPELPLVLDPQGRVYLRRYYDYERQLAAALHARALESSTEGDSDAPALEPSPPTVDADAPAYEPSPSRGRGAKRRARSAAGVDTHASTFEPSPSRAGQGGDGVDPDPAQQRAIDVALTRRLALITGGPGTGKTWSVVRMLVALATRAAAEGRRLEIALAAPTGKATARLLESVQAQLASLDLPADVHAQMPAEAKTVHRLLGLSPWRNAPKHDHATPLPFDVVVVDEVSMVDLPLMAKLVDAVAAKARLILLGDPKQLAAVEAGNVLGALVAATDAAPLADCHVALSVNHRFGADSALGQLAAAVAGNQPDAALACLTSGAAGVALEPPDLHRLVAIAADAYLPVVTTDSPAAALAAARNYRVLTALRRGPAGCLALDRAIAATIVRRLGLTPDARWWQGRLVLITANRPELGLYNGDTGVMFPDPDDPRHALKAWFDAADGAPRAFAPAALPPHEGAFALTVHKAQGSEFDRVALVTGPDSAVLTRELLYTGITRARTSVTLYADPSVLRPAIERPLLRMTGLTDRLREAAKET